jgi:DNA gyrase subunit B
MTTLNAGGKFDHNSYKVSAGLHGVGVSCVNALSEWMEVEVWRDDYLYYQRYERGIPQTPVEKRGRSGRRGTKVTFKPDPELFGESSFRYEIISNRLRELAFLNSGTKIVLSEEGGEEEVYHYANGITEFVGFLNEGKSPLHKDVISISEEQDDILVEVALQYNEGFSETVFSFANNINTVDGGTHLSGFRSAITRTFNQWARSQDILDKITPSGDDYREGLIAVVSVKLPSPQFEGQTKTRLGNREVQGTVEQVTGEKLGIYCEENPTAAKAIVKKAIEAARARDAAKKARALTRRKGALNRGNLPTKLRDCSSRKSDETELFIVEGQSAGGTASMGRNREFQAILPLRGVILNVEKARVDKMLANEEISTLISALGTGIGVDEFNLDGLRYDKVIIMTDADIDGAHIRTLLLTFFFRQMPELIDSGHLYIAQPPLYKVKRGRREQYVYDDRALQRVLVEFGSSESTMRYRLNGEETGSELDNQEFKKLLSLLDELEHLGRIIEKHGISFQDYLKRQKEGDFPLYRVTYIDSEKEESIYYFYSEDEYDQFVQRVQAEYDAEKEGADEIEIIEEDDYVGLARTRDSGNVIKPHKFHEKPRLKQIVNDIEGYGIPIKTYYTDGDGKTVFSLQANGQSTDVTSLAEVIPAVRSIGREGMEVDRYKGLGEMNANELSETTLDPESRTVIQVTVGDAIEADNYFSILAGKEVKRRREFIETHALEATNLDV